MPLHGQTKHFQRRFRIFHALAIHLLGLSGQALQSASLFSLLPMSTAPFVAKFGGTSLADANQFRKVKDIVLADPRRRFVVPSAPGKRHDKDQKITDLLLLCHEHASRRLPFEEIFAIIRERFLGIAKELGLAADFIASLDAELAKTKAEIARQGEAGGSKDYAASRGEAINGRILAAFLGWEFVDAQEVVFFNAKGQLDGEKTYAALAARVKNGPAVIPGFYGCDVAGKVKTFSRGGSDISGSIVARGVHAAVYENWTDVPGMLITNPKIVPGAYTIEVVTYQELRELSYSGATVLHEDAVFPVREAQIPVNIRSTNDPAHPGTLIVPREHPQAKVGYNITGIAGRKDFTVIQIEKAMMNAELGFCRRVLSVLEENGVLFEHMPSGIDTVSLVIQDSQLAGGKLEAIVDQLQHTVRPDIIEVRRNLALIATVGRGMARIPGLASRLFGALADVGIHTRMIDQGSSQLNIIIGVDADRFEDATRVIYTAFVSDAARPERIG